MRDNIIHETQDFTYLKWFHIRSSSGTAGTFLKSESVIEGKKIYYKLSNFDSVNGVIGHECVNEIIVARLLTLLAGILLYYEKEKTCIIELPEYLDEWNAPLLFTSYVKKIYTIPRDISLLWVKERVIPSGRRNIKEILAKHHMESYDEMRFLEISEGKCSQDSLYIRKIDILPDFVVERQKKNLVECVLLDEYTLFCFFADETIRKIDLKKLASEKDMDDLRKVLSHEKVYQSGKAGTGGYFVTFNNSIDIPVGVLYRFGLVIPLKMNDFKLFVQKKLLDTTESCDLLECSRQNLSYMVKRNHLYSIKKARGKLYLKGEILRLMW